MYLEKINKRMSIGPKRHETDEIEKTYKLCSLEDQNELYAIKNKSYGV